MERRGTTNFVQSLFFILLILIAGFVFLQSSVFEIREVQVNGYKFLNEDNIIELSGITLGTNIFKQNFQQAEQKIKLNPLVKTVTIHRQLPSTVEIVLEERKPKALIPVGSGYIQIDKEGYFLSRLEYTNKARLPFITGIKDIKGAAGKRIISEKLQTALAFLNQMPQGLTDLISEINVADADNVLLYTLEGVQVRLGDNSHIGDKNKILEEVMVKEIAGMKIEYIDLSINKPVIKYVENGEEE